MPVLNALDAWQLEQRRLRLLEAHRRRTMNARDDVLDFGFLDRLDREAGFGDVFGDHAGAAIGRGRGLIAGAWDWLQENVAILNPSSYNALFTQALLDLDPSNPTDRVVSASTRDVLLAFALAPVLPTAIPFIALLDLHDQTALRPEQEAFIDSLGGSNAELTRFLADFALSRPIDSDLDPSAPADILKAFQRENGIDETGIIVVLTMSTLDARGAAYTTLLARDLYKLGVVPDPTYVSAQQLYDGLTAAAQRFALTSTSVDASAPPLTLVQQQAGVAHAHQPNADELAYWKAHQQTPTIGQTPLNVLLPVPPVPSLPNLNPLAQFWPTALGAAGTAILRIGFPFVPGPIAIVPFVAGVGYNLWQYAHAPAKT